MKKIVSLNLFVLLSTVFMTSCEETKTVEDCTGVLATYNTTIKAHLDGNCAFSGCHAGPNPANGVDFSNYNSAKAFATNSGSTLICAIEHGSACQPMPKGAAKLDAAVIRAIRCWVDNGAPE